MMAEDTLLIKHFAPTKALLQTRSLIPKSTYTYHSRAVPNTVFLPNSLLWHPKAYKKHTLRSLILIITTNVINTTNIVHYMTVHNSTALV